MRTPHVHIPHFARPHLAGPSFTLRPSQGFGRLLIPRPRFLRRVDILALVVAGTLAAAVAVALAIVM